MKQKRVFPEGSLRNLARDTRVKATEPFGKSKNPFRQSLIGEKNITEKRRNKTYERQNVRNDKTIKSTSEKKKTNQQIQKRATNEHRTALEKRKTCLPHGKIAARCYRKWSSNGSERSENRIGSRKVTRLGEKIYR